MTAKEARKLTDEAIEDKAGHVNALVDSVLVLISGVARHGESSIVNPCESVRCVIEPCENITVYPVFTSKEKLAAYERLKVLGYKVQNRQSGMNESETVVSW